ncbi:MAG: hypothetical protein CMI24_06505 [Opitutae bacterium]|mgnify:FL=1|nr:hypothetical protein [Opitutae bacterium]
MMENLILKILRIAFHSFVLLSLFSKNGFAQPVDKAEPIEWQNPFKPDEVDKAIESGIKFLLSNQKDDGAIYDRGNPTAITALSLMSLAAVGHLPIHPNENGEAMSKALEFILLEKNQDEVGYFGKDGGRMYGHGIVTLTLAEMLGMGMNEETDKSIREKCQKAIDLILRSQKVRKSQSQQGGWRYSPDSNDADLSVTIWQLMALRSAKNSGLDVPSSAISDAIEYLKRSYKSKLDEQGEPIDKKSGFAYQPGGHPEYTTTAAGLLAMQVCGQYESPFVLGAADWLLENEPKTNRKFFFYGTYYYAQAMYQRGDEHADKSRKLVEEILLPMQKENGRWQGGGSESGAGDVYCSSMAMLALAVKYHYLPIYQR